MSIYFEKKNKSSWILSIIAILVGIFGVYQISGMIRHSAKKNQAMAIKIIDPASFSAKPTLVRIEKPTEGTEGLKAAHLTWQSNTEAMTNGPTADELHISFSGPIEIVGLHILPECTPVILGRVGLGVNHNPFLKPDPTALAPLLSTCASRLPPIWYPQAFKISADDTLVLGAAMNNGTPGAGFIKTDITIYYKWADGWAGKKWKSKALEGTETVQ